MLFMQHGIGNAGNSSLVRTSKYRDKKILLFVTDMIIYLKVPRKATPKLLEIISESSKDVAKRNQHKTIGFLALSEIQLHINKNIKQKEIPFITMNQK